MSFLETFWEGIKATSSLEWTAILAAIIYVILAAKRMLLSWLFALISSTLYVFVCFKGKLYLESGLQFFYIAMAIVGWLSWKKNSNQNEDVHIQSWNWKIHGLNIVLSGLFAVLVGWIFDTYTDQSAPYLDAFTTIYSLLATYMVTRGVLENWLYWVVIDFASIPLYASKGYYSTAVLFSIYTTLAAIGYITWYRKYKMQTA